MINTCDRVLFFHLKYQTLDLSTEYLSHLKLDKQSH